MKRLLISLVIVLFGCVAGMTSTRPYNTLNVINRSGGVVRVFADDGTSYRLGRAWPGKSCMRLRPTPNNVRFGIMHQQRGAVWMQHILVNKENIGWLLEINQPELAVYDMLNIMPSRLC